MSLLVSDSVLAARASVAAGSLQPLAASLAADLDPLRHRELYFPADKALLSREGGRCARDGTVLAFDPYSPHAHRCPVCGETYRGVLHDRYWNHAYQLWLAERAVHAALLCRLNVDPQLGALAAAILDGYAERYADYPNADNVLGPTRLFFSTYLESIWLLQICIATDLLDATHPALTARVRDRIIEPSRAIIAEYDEGASNRQVWNDAALLAASRVLGDARGAEAAVFGPSGAASHLGGGLLADGTWYEGENYHLFAHRGLWYGVTMAEQAGLELPAPLVERFQRGFAAPFVTALPDFTFPSRRDSQYAISLRQCRIAEHCELGFARRQDPALGAALYRLYRDDIPRGDTGRRTSCADVERNAPASALSRSDLGWRALLCALPELPSLEPAGPRSVLLEAQGFAVFRRNAGRTYVALDYGESGGGHGHGDRLNLLIADGDTRWLDDPGTGSYVDPSLPWYRSTLAHNAPAVDGRSQARANGLLSAFDERGAVGWIVAGSDEIAPPVQFVRTIVVLSTYLIDELSWAAAAPDTTVDLPIHADLTLNTDANLEAAKLSGGTGLEDGFRFLSDTSRALVAAGDVVQGRAMASASKLSLWARSDRDTEWWRARSLGPPGAADRWFRVLRARGASGRHRIVMAWANDVVTSEIDEQIVITLADGTRHVHRPQPGAWRVEFHAGGASSSVDLGGSIARTEVPLVVAERPEPPVLALSRRRSIVLPLGEAHYRRSEQSWRQAGEPAGVVTLELRGDALRIAIEVATSDLTFAPADATNPYDNEPADINGDSVQLYLRGPAGLSAWMLVPHLDSVDVRQRVIEGWDAPQPLHAAWERTPRGYRIDVDLDAVPDALDVIVNEVPRGRERRRGQLVMSGARGEFVYLRGDRHDAERLIPIRIIND